MPNSVVSRSTSKINSLLQLRICSGIYLLTVNMKRAILSLKVIRKSFNYNKHNTLKTSNNKPDLVACGTNLTS